MPCLINPSHTFAVQDSLPKFVVDALTLLYTVICHWLYRFLTKKACYMVGHDFLLNVRVTD